MSLHCDNKPTSFAGRHALFLNHVTLNSKCHQLCTVANFIVLIISILSLMSSGHAVLDNDVLRDTRTGTPYIYNKTI